MIRALIVDDEPPARQIVRAHLAGHPDIEIMADAEDGPSAVSAITRLQPDLVFLDIQMPGMDGFEVVREASRDHLPVFVFVTAHDQFALRAFEVHALDYLLKPFSPDRFAETLSRVRAEIDRGADRESPNKMAGLIEGTDVARSKLENPSGWVRRFVVRDRDHFLILSADEVEWIESAGNYASIQARGRTFLIRETMSDLADKLDPERFARIHRRTIVSLDRIREIRGDVHGSYDAILQSGKTLAIGRHYLGALMPRGR